MTSWIAVKPAGVGTIGVDVDTLVVTMVEVNTLVCEFVTVSVAVSRNYQDYFSIVTQRGRLLPVTVVVAVRTAGFAVTTVVDSLVVRTVAVSFSGVTVERTVLMEHFV